MRFTGIGVAAALVLAFVAPSAAMAAPKKPAAAGAVDAKSRARGMADVPALVTAAGLNCTVADARFIGEDKKAAQAYYELACNPGLGGVLLTGKDGGKPQFYTCLETNKPAADGKPGALACILPGNADTVQSLAPFVAKAGTPCTIEKARAIGSSPTTAFFEVACQGGAGYIVQASSPPDASKEVKMATCLGFQPGETLFCELSNSANQLAVADTLAASAGKNCVVEDKRYVMATVSGSMFFEVSCQDGKGYMLEQNAQGALARSIDCVNAGFVAGGCTLTDTAVAQTEQNNVYSGLATAAGFPCKVEKYGVLPTERASKEVIELKCSDRPDGGIGIFEGKSNVVLNCAIAEAQGYRCSFSPKTAAYSQVTANLKTLGKSDCTVSETRAMDKRTEGLAYIETACSDGLPGWVIGYQLGTSTPKEALSCLQGQSLGGCKLPTNIKKKS